MLSNYSYIYKIQHFYKYNVTDLSFSIEGLFHFLFLTQIFVKMNVKGSMMKENKSDSTSSSSSSIGTFSEDSMNSLCSCSSELIEDADSSSTSSSHSNGSLCDLSELMNNLPIKRGLSMFYEGKTESFSCLGEVEKMEDVGKKSMAYKKRMKSCTSYGNRIWYSPKATISKKTSRVPFSSLLSKRGSFLQSSRPSILVHKNY